MGYGWGPGGGGVQGWGGASGGSPTPGETPNGIPYTFDTETSAAGIAAGQVRANNATAGSITALYIAQTDGATQDQGMLLATLSAGGLVYLNTVADDTVVSVFKITAVVVSGTYYTLTGTYLSGVMPGDGSEIRVTIAPTEVTGVRQWTGNLISQTGTSDPVINVLLNNLDQSIQFQYDDTGRYLASIPAITDASLVDIIISNPVTISGANTYIVKAAASIGGVTIVSYNGDTPANDIIGIAEGLQTLTIKVY